jgi:hypothetical protein
MDELRKLINRTKGFCIAVNSNLIDSDAMVFINYEDIFIHFKFREYEDIKIKLANIKDIKYDYIGQMIIAILYLSNDKIISIHCL